jgi:hypothetical protein
VSQIYRILQREKVDLAENPEAGFKKVKVNMRDSDGNEIYREDIDLSDSTSHSTNVYHYSQAPLQDYYSHLSS